MSSQPDTREMTAATVQRITSLLSELPPDSLALIEQLVERLRVADSPQAAPFARPTVIALATSLTDLSDLLLPGYEGDALADSEALYDDQP